MRSTHVVEQLSFSTLLSLLTLDFDIVLGSLFTFWGPNELFFGLMQSSKPLLMSAQYNCCIFSINIRDDHKRDLASRLKDDRKVAQTTGQSTGMEERMS